MKYIRLLASLIPFLFFAPASLYAQTSKVVVFQQSGFPTVDTGEIPALVLHLALPDAVFKSAGQLHAALSDPHTRLLVLPYGSAFPMADWDDIHTFLLRGGDLLTLGGRPFTRPVQLVGDKWIALQKNYGFSRQLLISDYQKTPGSSATVPTVNNEEPVSDVTELRWKRAYSMVIRLSQEASSSLIGASGTFDAQLKPLLWGAHNGVHLAAPVVEIDHFQNNYTGGRWVMVNCQMSSEFSTSRHAVAIIRALARQASMGAELLRVIPVYPLYLRDEAWQLELQWNRYQQPAIPSTASITIQRNGVQELVRTVKLDVHNYPVDQTITLPSNGQPGFHAVTVHLYCGQVSCGIYHTAFWVRDKAFLDSGPQVSVNHNYFLINGKPIEVVGTTYMDSSAQRLYFRYPNPYVWNKDMKQISAAGINMLRTGLWADWNLVTGNTDVATQHTLRTMEAYLMTARSYHLPVQFTLFSFEPNVFGGKDAYLGPQALSREHTFVASMVTPFANVPYLMWDLINEPSFDNPNRLFATHPNGDVVENAIWNQWLMNRYGSRDVIEEAWDTVLPPGPVTPPGDSDMTAQSANDGGRPLSVYDFNLFAQQSFAKWAEGMRKVIRGTGSQQLITVGQDEGGGFTSPSPSYFKPAVDFTTTHSWWQNNDLLWDSLMAKQNGLPMLIQETGVMPQTNANGMLRRSPDEDAALLERKLGLSFDTGAGAIEWLWNINAIEWSQQEVTIGAVRPDGTEKPEAAVLKDYAAFAKSIQDYLQEPQPAPVTILTSQAEQFSVLSEMATEAQQRAVRVMSYRCRIAVRVVSENHVKDIAGSQLTVLPSAQMLRDATWRELLSYVKNGGNLLITGPIGRDAHWQLRKRLREVGIQAKSSNLLYRSSSIQIGTKTAEADFSTAVQGSLETITLANGKSYIERNYGKGRIFVVDAPVELAESPAATDIVYRYVFSQLGIKPSFEDPGLSPSVLVRPVIFKNAVLYLFSSESSSDQTIDMRDDVSGGYIKLQLPALRTKMVLLSRKTGKAIAMYRGPQLVSK